MRAIHLPLLTAVLSLCTVSASLGANVPYLTGFESSEGFSPGSLDGQGPWFVDAGTSTVQSTTTAHGSQAVRLDPGAGIGVSITGAVGAVVWVDTFVRTSGTANPPDLGSMSARSSVVHFSSTSGIQALDGNGGGGGSFVSTGVFPDGNAFRRITMRQDYSAREWDIWIDGELKASDLGFKDDSIDRLSGLRQYSEQEAYLDSVSATLLGIADDADGDGLVDLDEIKFYGTDPYLADTDGDGRSDGDEIIAGTDPTDAADSFHALVESGDTDVRVTFSTIVGRLYTVEFATDLVAHNWAPVADSGFVNRAGTGGLLTYIEDPAPAVHTFYRVKVEKPQP